MPYSSFCFQIAYKKVINLHISVNRLVGKVLINLLHHALSLLVTQSQQLVIDAIAKVQLSKLYTLTN